MKKQTLLVLTTFMLIIGSLVMVGRPVVAEGFGIDFNENPACKDEAYREANPEECPVNLDSIEFPTLISFAVIENFSIFSYIAFALNMLFIGITILWIFLVISAAFEYINSQGNPEKIQESNKRIGNVFISITILLIGFVILVVVAGFFGFGNFLEWPKVLSQCKDGTLYITKTLELEASNSSGREVSDEQIAAACFD